MQRQVNRIWTFTKHPTPKGSKAFDFKKVGCFFLTLLSSQSFEKFLMEPQNIKCFLTFPGQERNSLRDKLER